MNTPNLTIGHYTVQTAFDNVQSKKEFSDWVRSMKNANFTFTDEARTLINKLRKSGKRFQMRMSVQEVVHWELTDRAGLQPS